MPMPSPKELKKIAKACREAGIKRYRGEGFELEFTDDAPEPKRTRKLGNMPQVTDSPANTKFTTDSLSETDLLFWSSGEGGENVFEQDSE